MEELRSLLVKLCEHGWTIDGEGEILNKGRATFTNLRESGYGMDPALLHTDIVDLDDCVADFGTIFFKAGSKIVPATTVARFALISLEGL